MPTPILHSLDQTSQVAVVHNTVIGADITLALAGGGAQVLSTRVDDLDLEWKWAANALFDDLGDQAHQVWQGDFTGSSTTEILFYYRGDGNWWLGTVSATMLTWRAVGNTAGFGNLLDGAHPIWIGDFTGIRRQQVLFYSRGDGNWWLGTIAAGRLTWQLLGNTSGFGNLLDGAHPIWIGDFTGIGRQQVLFYYRGDGNWWLGTIAGGVLAWDLVGNTAGFGNLLDGQHSIWFGDFNGLGRLQALFYYVGDGHWWLGTVTAGALSWSLVATARFGDLSDGRHPVWLGNFTGRGRPEVLFYFSGDGNWWLGSIDQSAMTWRNVANTGFGNLLDGAHRAWQGNFTGLGSEQILFYYRGDGNWWLGQMTGSVLTWTLAANTAGFGNLLDVDHRFLQGEFSGNGRSSLVFYYNGDGNWWHGRVDGTTMSWSLPSNSRGFGDLLDGQHRIWTGKYSGSPKSEILFHYRGDGNFFLGQFDGARLRLPRSLNPGETLVATQTVGHGRPLNSQPVVVGHNFATQHYDRPRTGWNFRETTLTSANVHGLRRLYTLPTDDQVYAQPLYVQNVRIAGQLHDVLYVATERATVYAFDAQSNLQLLRRSLLRPGEQPVPSTDIYVPGYLNIWPAIGITGTPVIDCANNALFVVSKCKDSQGRYHQRLHSLELETLGERPCVGDIVARFAAAEFDALASNQRAGLLLSEGLIYVAFGSHGDQHPDNVNYYGWVLAFDARTLNLQGVFNAAPGSTAEAGIWQSGQALAADADGRVYCTTGNGAFSPAAGNFSNSVVKLDVGLQLLDYFAPKDQKFLNSRDMDLGSGGVLVLPDQSTGPRRLVLTGGKQGYLYLLNRDGLGGEEQPANPRGIELYPGHLSHDKGNPAGSDASQVGMFGGPAYLRNAATQFVFVCGTGGEGQGQLVRFELANGRLGKRQQSVRRFPGSATPVVTGREGDAVVWLLDRGNPLKLVAFAANDLTRVLFEQDAGTWSNPQGNPFVVPTVMAGKVYVPSADGVTVFGL